MIRRVQLRGTGVALVTPFKNGKIDFNAVERLLSHVIDGGVDFLVPLGSTGEAALLSDEEQLQLLEFIVDFNQERLPIISGHIAGNNTAKCLQKIEAAGTLNLDGYLVASPAYVKPSDVGLIEHYSALAEHSSKPILLYNVPGRTASNMSSQVTLKLAEKYPNRIWGIKEASNDMKQIHQILKYRPDDFLVISGDDEMSIPLIAGGADGTISVIANAFPRLFSDLIKHGLEGNFTSARAKHEAILDIHPWLYIDGNPSGIKEALSHLNICSNELRLPLCPMTSENKLGLITALDKL